MVDVRRENVILTIDEEDIERYYEKGYSVLDKFGNVAKASVPTDVGTLQKAYVEQQELLKQKDNEIENLRAQIKVLLAAMSNPEASKTETRGRKRKEP